MAPIRIPDGQVFVARAPGVAAALLDAAEELGYARHEAVRTVSGGYHVNEDIAAKYQESLPEVDESAETPEAPSSSTAAVDSQQVQSDPGAQQAAGSAGLTDAGTATPEAGDDPKSDDPKTATPRDGWSHAQFDEWADNQDPKVVYPSGANLAQKLEIATTPADQTPAS